MIFESFVKDLCRIPGLEDLQPNKEGVYVLRINKIYDVYFAESQTGTALFVYSPLCAIPQDTELKLSLFSQLLSANCFAQTSAHGWFASNSSTQQILYTTCIPNELLSKDRFFTELQELISCVTYWREHLVESLAQRPDKPSLEKAFYIKP